MRSAGRTSSERPPPGNGPPGRTGSGRFQSRATAVAVMVLVTLMWSSAGIVSRQLESAQGLEVTFWRSAANAGALVLLLSLWKGPAALADALRCADRHLWASGACWAVMFTAFMTALMLTTVAHVLVTMALAPLATALMAWRRLHIVPRPATRWALCSAGLGIVWMLAPDLEQVTLAQAAGLVCALAVPLASALNWTLLQERQGEASALGLMPAVLLGALGSCALALLLSTVLGLTAGIAGPAAPPWHWSASLKDIGWLSVLGVFQLAVPCLLAVAVAGRLAAAEVSLLSLLEVVFGVSWAWLGTSEPMHVHTVLGGALVLVTLALHEVRPGEWAARRGGR